MIGNFGKIVGDFTTLVTYETTSFTPIYVDRFVQLYELTCHAKFNLVKLNSWKIRYKV